MTEAVIRALSERLERTRQNYVVCPDQPWLDWMNAGDLYIRQFVAMPLSMGYTVEGQVTGKEEFGGIQLVVYDPKPGRFPDEPPVHERRFGDMLLVMDSCESYDVGLAAGGRMRQKI